MDKDRYWFILRHPKTHMERIHKSETDDPDQVTIQVRKSEGYVIKDVIDTQDVHD